MDTPHKMQNRSRFSPPSIIAVHVSFARTVDASGQPLAAIATGDMGSTWPKLFDRSILGALRNADLLSGIPDKQTPTVCVYQDWLSSFFVNDWRAGGEIIHGEIEALGFLPRTRISWWDQAEEIYRPIYPLDKAAYDPSALVEAWVKYLSACQTVDNAARKLSASIKSIRPQ